MLSTNQIDKIKADVEQTAAQHLHTKDLATALSHYTEDAIAVSNTDVFASREALADEIGNFYKILKTVNHASWSEINIQVINETAATFSARFTYSFTDTDDQTTNLTGVWTALFVRDNDTWKIRLRHESVEQI